MNLYLVQGVAGTYAGRYPADMHIIAPTMERAIALALARDPGLELREVRMLHDIDIIAPEIAAPTPTQETP